jgi:hypothetical protein
MDSALCVNNTVCIMSCTASSFAQSDGARCWLGPVHGQLKQMIEQVKTGSRATCHVGDPASSLLYFRF